MNMEIKKDISLSKYTSMRVGGPAEHFCEPSSLEELKSAVAYAREHRLGITIISGGTNVIVPDAGIKGLVICLRRFLGIEAREENGRLYVEAWAGTPKTSVMKEFLKRKLAPAMFLAGLPGDVGGGVVMNAGVGNETLCPREFVEIVDWVEVLREGHIIRLKHEDIKWEYRGTGNWQPGIITKVLMSWALAPDEKVLDKVRELNKWRNEKQPLEFPNTGSVFKNPPGEKAGKLIDQCGLKGFRIGDAQISEKHGNFIVNCGKATSADLKNLVLHIQTEVKKQKGIDLHPEWIFL